MLEENKTLRVKKNPKKNQKQTNTLSVKKIQFLLVLLAPTLGLQAQLVLVKIWNFTNITSFSEVLQSALGDGDNIMLTSTVPGGNDRVQKGK